MYHVYNVWITNNTLTKYWIKIPVHGVRGGIRLPIKLHCEIEEDWKFKEAKVFRRGDDWFVHITVEKDIKIRQSYDNILAIDLGIRRIATVVSTADKRPKFYGKELRRIRGHYFYLRRKLGKQKKFKAIKKIGKNERRIIDDYLHKISREIVERAKERECYYRIGRPEGNKEAK